MQTKVTKPVSKQVSKMKSIRIQPDTQKKIERILALANKKQFGRKIKMEHLLNLAVEVVTDHHIEMLREQSLTHEDRKEMLRQKYIEKHGAITKEQFTGFMMSPEYFDFLKEHAQGFSAE